ncbi:MAG: radical SAM protein [Candidatus Omnitrophica bacterium]|nr:radical SAM protein [Candidatus Omnitrophota bacterium]
MIKFKRIIPKKIRMDFWRLKDNLLSLGVRDALHCLRVQKPLTKLLGPYYQQNYNKIEINMTFDCNVKCINCSQSCRQAPSSEQVSIEQIKKFIQESIQQERRWERIILTGGEPTLHPLLLDAVSLLLDYKRKYSNQTSIDVFTNGSGIGVSRVLSKLPAEIVVNNSNKSSIVNMFYPINIAPVDLKEYEYTDYSNACGLAEKCGYGLNSYGYYFCGIAGGIDRVFGLDIGRKEMPMIGDILKEQRSQLCRYCGFFQRKYKHSNEGKISRTWHESYENYKRSKPRMSYY